eukprot:4523918-Amphidinium_carterae.1
MALPSIMIDLLGEYPYKAEHAERYAINIGPSQNTRYFSHSHQGACLCTVSSNATVPTEEQLHHLEPKWLWSAQRVHQHVARESQRSSNTNLHMDGP